MVEKCHVGMIVLNSLPIYLINKSLFFTQECFYLTPQLKTI